MSCPQGWSRPFLFEALLAAPTARLEQQQLKCEEISVLAPNVGLLCLPTYDTICGKCGKCENEDNFGVVSILSQLAGRVYFFVYKTTADTVADIVPMSAIAKTN